MDDLTGEFVAETREMLERIGDALLSWEAHPGDAGRLDEIFRFVHTVKGSCGFIDLPRIEALAHAAETELARVRAQERSADALLVGAMLAIIDRIGALVAALEAPEIALPDADTDRLLIAALDRAAVVAAPDAKATATAPARSVRVAVPLLEALMTQVSDLVLVRNELARAVRLSADPALVAGFERLAAVVTDLRDSVTRTRMQPIERLFASLPRLVRDTANECGKSVTLELSGQNVEIDREMVEAIRDPLVHIVRNAIDHGIEQPEARVLAGKPSISILRISAQQSGNQVSIEISDDGRGIDTADIVRRAVAANKVDPKRAATLDEATAVSLIFEAGLSTADRVTNISGRGVGMDVVRANVEQLGGTVAVLNRPGLGLSVTLRAPLTLSIVNALVVQVGGQGFAVPRGSVDEVVALDRAHARIDAVGGGHLAIVRGVTLPAFHLCALLGLEAASPRLALIIATPAGVRYVLAVDAVLDQEELVVRPMAPLLVSQGVFAGQSLGDDGRPVIVLDPVGIAAAVGLSREVQAPNTARVQQSHISGTAVVATAIDGQRIAVRSLLVERLIETDRGDWTKSGGRWFARVEGQLLPSAASGTLPEQGAVPAMLLSDGQRRAVLPIGAVHDLTPVDTVVAVDDPELEGLLMIGDHAVPLLSGMTLFQGTASASTTRRVAALQLDPTPWAQAILAPFVRAAGYDVVFGPTPLADLIIRLEGEATTIDAAPCLNLARQPDGRVDIARYDRETLQALFDGFDRRAA